MLASLLATTLILPTSLPNDCGLFAPLAADEIIRAGVQEIHRDEREQLRCAALEEDHIVRVAQAEELFAARDRLVVDGFKFLAAMADFGDAKSFALIIQQRGGGFLQNLGWQHRRTGTEIKNPMRHILFP